jgi:hypothetical protein
VKISKRNEKTESQLQAATPFKGLAGCAGLSADVARSAGPTTTIFAAPLKDSSAMHDKTLGFANPKKRIRESYL